jgi:uncharacterized protein YajQ (UPF0234 family)
VPALGYSRNRATVFARNKAERRRSLQFCGKKARANFNFITFVMIIITVYRTAPEITLKAMPTFDIISKIDVQRLDNAINAAIKEVSTRYDFNNSKSAIELDKKTMMIHVLTENDMRMKTIEGMIIGRLVKQGLDPQALDFGKELYASGNMVKKDIRIKQGIDKETAKKIVKSIKDTGLKVQPSIMDEQVRVSGKKIDDLQHIIGLLEKMQVGIPLQFENFRS